jgi:RmlD substrate binding domain
MAPGAKEGLIGFTGFVGGSLAHSHEFESMYNSTNVEDLHGRSFDLLVCAGVNAAKWLAEKDPEKDRAAIDRLTAALSGAKAREFILISTIDVYDNTSSYMDEDGTIEPAGNHSYGRHRYELERWVMQRFPEARVVRLPALFGKGLKKNALYDLLNNNAVHKINPAGIYQWYPVHRLWGDLTTIRRANLTVVNLFTAPIPMSEIIGAFFVEARVGEQKRPAPTYNLRTKHDLIFGGRDGYIVEAEYVLGEMARFVADERRRNRPPR